MTTHATSQRADLAEAKEARAKATAARDMRIRKMVEDGFSHREVAEAFSTSKSHVEKALARTKP